MSTFLLFTTHTCCLTAWERDRFFIFWRFFPFSFIKGRHIADSTFTWAMTFKSSIRSADNQQQRLMTSTHQIIIFVNCCNKLAWTYTNRLSNTCKISYWEKFNWYVISLNHFLKKTEVNFQTSSLFKLLYFTTHFVTLNQIRAYLLFIICTYKQNYTYFYVRAFTI